MLELLELLEGVALVLLLLLRVLEAMRGVVATLLFLLEELDVLGIVALVSFFLLLLDEAGVEGLIVSRVCCCSMHACGACHPLCVRRFSSFETSSSAFVSIKRTIKSSHDNSVS